MSSVLGYKCDFLYRVVRQSEIGKILSLIFRFFFS